MCGLGSGLLIFDESGVGDMEKIYIFVRSEDLKNRLIMIDKKKRQQIIALMKREVVPAIGCTEPMAVSLCVAKATET